MIDLKERSEENFINEFFSNVSKESEVGGTLAEKRAFEALNDAEK